MFMVKANLWTEADLVKGACRRIVSLRVVKPVDGQRSRTHSRLSGVSRTRSVASTSLRGPNHLNVGWQHKGCPAYFGLGHHNPQGTQNDYSTPTLGPKKFGSGLTFVVALSRPKTFHGLQPTASVRLGTVTSASRRTSKLKSGVKNVAATTP